ncbi:hypothetical protein N9V70_02345, partial [Candidatus Pelagibacter bacterium]|nr:hypothetical protein [Candidatus Pelagibacter bacterium]
MKDFYTQFKKTVDKSLTKVSYRKIKKDSSMLTNNDLIVQNRIILLIKKFFPEVKQFISEEKFNVKNLKKINFKEPFAIIDPIDGTENFFAENGMFGTLVSINLKHEKKIDIIYLPSKNVMITRENLFTFVKKPKKNNNISMLSTKCLNNNFKGSKYRMYGSSAFSFYKFITGEANEFIYCKGAKI